MNRPIVVDGLKVEGESVTRIGDASVIVRQPEALWLNEEKDRVQGVK